MARNDRESEQILSLPSPHWLSTRALGTESALRGPINSLVGSNRQIPCWPSSREGIPSCRLAEPVANRGNPPHARMRATVVTALASTTTAPHAGSSPQRRPRGLRTAVAVARPCGARAHAGVLHLSRFLFRLVELPRFPPLSPPPAVLITSQQRIYLRLPTTPPCACPTSAAVAKQPPPPRSPSSCRRCRNRLHSRCPTLPFPDWPSASRRSCTRGPPAATPSRPHSYGAS